MAEIVRATGINVGSCFAVLSSLVDNGFLSRDDVQKSYGLGPALIAVGQAAFEHNPITACAQRAVKDLAYDLDAAVILTTKLGWDQLVLGVAESRSGHKFEVGLGQRLALTPPLGAHLVAWSSPAEIDAWIERAHPGQQTAAEWRAGLELIRERGYQVSLRDPGKAGFSEMLARMSADDPVLEQSEAIEVVNEYGWDLLILKDINSEESYAVSTIAAPIFLERGKPPLCLCAGVFGRKLSGAEVDDYVHKIMETCMRLMDVRRLP